MLVIILVTLLFPFCSACSGGGYDSAPTTRRPRPTTRKATTTTTTTTTTTVKPKLTVIEKYASTAWNGFEVPESKTKEWNEWFDKYKLGLIHEANDTAALSLFSRDPASGWPLSWMGLDAGHGGFPPNEQPPWSFVPKNTGLPTYCLLPLMLGNCKEKITRWAYNQFEDNCVSVVYTGCGGNENNFHSKEKCIEKCINVKPPSPCDLETDISRESVLFDIHRRCGYK